MKTSLKLSILVLAFSAAGVLSACESMRSKPGPDGTAYSLFVLDGVLNGSPQQVVKAAEGVLKEMNLHIVSSLASGVDGKVLARTALDRQIEIRVKHVDDATSKIAIQVGNFGDQALSREIYRKTKAKL